MTKYILYKTTNLINGRYYIGKHKQDTEEFDGYLGSGHLLKKAIEKYGKENFIRETIEIFDSESECYDAEERVLSDLWADRNSCYNIAPGGCSGFSHLKQQWWDENTERKEYLSNKWKDFNPSYTDDGKDRIRKANRERVWSEESRKKCGDVSRGKTKPKTECIYCGRMIANNMLHRYHMENCKEKPNDK